MGDKIQIWTCIHKQYLKITREFIDIHVFCGLHKYGDGLRISIMVILIHETNITYFTLLRYTTYLPSLS